MTSPNLMILASSEADANLYYATRFIAPDAFAYFRIRGRSYLLLSDLEVDRARCQAAVDQVISISQFSEKVTKKSGKKLSYLDLLVAFCKQHRVKEWTVPENFPLGTADRLRKRGLRLTSKPNPFFETRTIKTSEEIRAITRALRHTESAVALAVGTIKKSVIKKGLLYLGGKVLTSEAVKKIINVKLMESGCVATHSIVSCGTDGVDPHNEGSGPLRANQPIIMDIFPKDSTSRYFADFTRTVVRGKASEKIRKMYAAVREAQNMAFRTIRHGIDSNPIHAAIHQHFESLGFKTGLKDGRMQGFFHGTGHGVGLNIHEAPRIGGGKEILKAGQVVTVEPGLYYHDAGGVRLEDLVVVTKTGCQNLTRFPKILEL